MTLPKNLTLPGIDRAKRRSPRVMAKLLDAGDGCAEYECRKCGWNSGWVGEERSWSKMQRGIPCKECNAGGADA